VRAPIYYIPVHPTKFINDVLKFRVTADHAAATTLGKEARRWSTRIAREISGARENKRKLQVLQQLKEAGQKVRAFAARSSAFQSSVQI
jgi:hypothetical protein